MAFYSSASNASLWRGVDYYKAGKVLEFSEAADGKISGTVLGSEESEYSVDIDLSHPKRSTCTCPFATGRQVICKHMIALYFASIPDSYELFQRDVEEMEAQYLMQEELWKKETHRKIKESVSKLSAKEAKERLVEMMYQDALEDRYRYDDRW